VNAPNVEKLTDYSFLATEITELLEKNCHRLTAEHAEQDTLRSSLVVKEANPFLCDPCVLCG